MTLQRLSYNHLTEKRYSLSGEVFRLEVGNEVEREQKYFVKALVTLIIVVVTSFK